MRPGAALAPPVAALAAALAAFVAFVAAPATAAGAPPLPLTVSSTASHENLGFVVLDEGWVMHAGDDPAWSGLTYDDSSWRPVPRAWGFMEAVPVDQRDGIAWLRLRLDVPMKLTGEKLALFVAHVGSMELFLDGERIGFFGDVDGAEESGEHVVSLSPRILFPVKFRWPGEHVLSARLSTTRPWLTRSMEPARVIALGIGDESSVARYRAWLARSQRIATSFASAALALGALHLFIFLFRRTQRVHFYYAASSTAVAIVAFSGVGDSMVETLSGAVVYIYVSRVAILATCVFGLLFYYSAFDLPLPRRFWGFAIVGGLLALTATIAPPQWVMIFALAALAEELRVLIVANLRRIDGAWIVLLGGGASVLTASVQVLMLLGWIRSEHVPVYFYLYGFLALLISMSVYLARSFARTEHSLAAQLVRVQELSALAVEQERRAQEEQTARLLLEADNLRQEDLLEEANKREAVLRQLEQAHAELAAAHEELRRAQAKLAQSERMASLGQLVAGIAHEINTPVGAMASAQDSTKRALVKLREVLDRELPPAVRSDTKLTRLFGVLDDAGRVLESGAGRITNIVRRLKTFARLDESELKKVDLHEGLEDTLMLLDHELRGHVEVVRDYGALPPVACFPGQLNQVFLNLIHNARQAIPGSGRIEISTRLEDGRAKIRVKDSGVGIPPENLRKIFEPGFTTKGVRVGTGLGLAICYRIVEEHQGEITVESTLGEGATFTVSLPLDLEARLAAKKLSAAAPPTG